MSDRLRGTAGDDRLSTDAPGVNVIIGNRGNDLLDLSVRGGGGYGGLGDDTLLGGGAGTRQSHLYGGPGSDHIHLNTGNNEAPYGDHAWGGQGPDKFHFTINPNDTARITGRLDDFDPSRDSIWINGNKLDFQNLPDNVRIVQHHSQPWILIDGRVLYALEGARQFAGAYDADYDGDGQSIEFGNGETEEAHFIAWPKAWAKGVPESADLPYHDLYAYFPRNEYHGAVEEWHLPTFAFTPDGDTISGTSADENIAGGDGADFLAGNGGNDLMHGGEYDDTIYGGRGGDSISGGLDNDRLYGGDGRDVIYGGSGQDRIYGGTGDDRLGGNNGQDTIFGEAGNDKISGGWSDDTLYGGAGNDVLWASFPEILEDIHFRQSAELYGGDGDDTLHGEINGDTTIEGGAGEDVVVLHRGAELTIRDFVPGQDFLDLNGFAPPDEEYATYLEERLREDGGTNMVLSLGSYGAIVFEHLGEADRVALLASIGQEEEVDEGLYPDPGHPGPETPGGDDDDDDPDDDKDDDSSDGSCFVATACFGGAAHPDVAWLRQYRNKVLRRSWGGRAFIGFYWRVGPIMARFVRYHGVTGRALRAALGALVRLGRRHWPEV